MTRVRGTGTGCSSGPSQGTLSIPQQPGQQALTQHHCILFATEFLLQSLLQGVKHHVQKVAGRQGNLLVLHPEHC